jgi:hypothetical protein
VTGTAGSGRSWTIETVVLIAVDMIMLQSVVLAVFFVIFYAVGMYTNRGVLVHRLQLPRLSLHSALSNRSPGTN